MCFRRAPLLAAVFVPFICYAQPATEPPSVFDAFPVPPPSKELLFYLQRNKNANAIVYEARLDQHGQLMAKDPVVVHWIRYTDGGKREGISIFEDKWAYGVRHTRTEKGVARMRFVASNKYPFRVEVAKDGQAEARMMINGRYARLRHVEVQAKESSFLPKVLHVDLYGTVVGTGEEIHERIFP
ncbi:MAG: DUF4833 domain-containing protein [Flavobacteriales bacterium]|nr:DUF4833 domain-containing protein [Flavobacteriales bacterium]